MQAAQVGSVQVNSAEGKYSLDMLMGEPVISGSFKYEASERLHYSTVAFLICQAPATPRYYVQLDPSIPDPGKGYGFNVPGSPAWDKVFKRTPETKGSDYLDAASAQAFWKNGFTVIGMLLVADPDKAARDRPSTSKPATPAGQGQTATGGESGRAQPAATATDRLARPNSQPSPAAPAGSQPAGIQEELRRQQEASPQRQRELEQRRRETEAQRGRQQAEAQKRMDALRRQSAEAERKRQEAAEKFRNEQEEKRAEAKRKADALATEFARQNREMSDTIDRGVRDINNVFDQIARANAESRESSRLKNEERDRREEAREAREKLAKEEEMAEREHEAELERLREEEARLRREAEYEQARLQDQQRQEAAQREKAKKLRMEAKENSLKSDAAAALNSLTKRPSATKSSSAFDLLDAVSTVTATNRLGTNVPASAAGSTNAVHSAAGSEAK